MGTKWPNWVRNDQTENKSGYEMTKMVWNDLGTKWPGYEMTGYRQRLSVVFDCHTPLTFLLTVFAFENKLYSNVNGLYWEQSKDNSYILIFKTIHLVQKKEKRNTHTHTHTHTHTQQKQQQQKKKTKKKTQRKWSNILSNLCFTAYMSCIPGFMYIWLDCQLLTDKRLKSVN